MRRFLNWWYGKTPAPPLHTLQSTHQPHVSVIVRERSLLLACKRGQTVLHQGSACVLDRHTLLTANHVVDSLPPDAVIEATGLLTHPMDGQRARVGRILARDEPNDLALLALDTPLPYDIPYLGIHAKVGLVGDELHVFSSRQGEQFALRITVAPSVRQNSRAHDTVPMASKIATTAKLKPGDSGSGLFTADGRLAGVLTHLHVNQFTNLRTGDTTVIPLVNLATYTPAIRKLLQSAYWPGLAAPPP